MNAMDIELEKLRRHLRRQFPPHHYAHVPIFSAYWTLVDTINRTKPVDEQPRKEE